VTRLILVALTAGILCLAAASSAGAARPPTEAELAELTAAAQTPGPPYTYRELGDVRVSTVDETWAAAVVVKGFGEDNGSTALFKHKATGEWKAVAFGFIGEVSHGIGMPAAVQRDLGVVDPQPNPHRAPSQVICATTYGPVGQAKGAYRTRPHECLFHKRGAPVDYADTIGASHLHWLHWGRRNAVGMGMEAANMTGLVPMKVRLTRPVTICGHTVFTVAHFKFHGSFGNGLTLDNRLRSSSCAARRVRFVPEHSTVQGILAPDLVAPGAHVAARAGYLNCGNPPDWSGVLRALHLGCPQARRVFRNISCSDPQCSAIHSHHWRCRRHQFGRYQTRGVCASGNKRVRWKVSE
jgi:hypothetical protein